MLTFKCSLFLEIFQKSALHFKFSSHFFNGSMVREVNLNFCKIPQDASMYLLPVKLESHCIVAIVFVVFEKFTTYVKEGQLRGTPSWNNTQTYVPGYGMDAMWKSA